MNRTTTDSLKRAASQLLKANYAHASAGFGSNTISILNGTRDIIGTVVGYGDHASYLNLVCNGDPGACDGAPEVGIVGAVASFVNQLPTIGGNAGITSCDAVPSTGTATGNDSNGNSVTLTFQTATHTIPAGWTGGSTTFAHRVVFSGSLDSVGAMNIAYEFNCGDSSAAYAAIGMDMTAQMSQPYNRDIALYSGAVDGTHNGFQLFMAEHHRSHSDQVRTAYALDIHYNPSTSEFNLWGMAEGNLTNGLNMLLNSPSPEITLPESLKCSTDRSCLRLQIQQEKSHRQRLIRAYMEIRMYWKAIHLIMM